MLVHKFQVMKRIPLQLELGRMAWAHIQMWHRQTFESRGSIIKIDREEEYVRIRNEHVQVQLDANAHMRICAYDTNAYTHMCI